MKTMLRSLWITCLSLVAASCATEEDPVESLERETREILLEPVSMHPALDDGGNPIPGTLVFDTSEGRLDITRMVPDQPRVFESQRAFHDWVVLALNAKRIDGERGDTGTSIEYTAATTLRFDRELGDFVAVDDPVAMIIGGRAGYVVIAGEEVCTSRTAECSEGAGLAEPERNTRTIVPAIRSGFSGPFQILGSTWIAHSSWIRWVGSNTSQWYATSGVQLSWTSCSWTPEKWCLTQTGSNFLSTAYSGYLYPRSRSGAASAFNTWSVMSSQVDFGFPPTTAANYTCASHFGASGPDSVFLITGHGPQHVPFNDC